MTKPKMKAFVKSADTTVPVQESIEGIKALVRRHGAVGFGIREDYRSGKALIEFALKQGEQAVPVHIPLDVERVQQLMYLHAPKNDEAAQKRREQAERTAWRQLYLIIDAVLTASQLGVMTITDAFLAHMMVVTEDGKSERMGDYVQRGAGALGAGVRALLPASTGKSS